VAVASTVATTFTKHFVTSHPGTTAATGSALTHGFQIAFYVLAGIAIAGAILAALLVESGANAGQTESQGELMGVPAFEEA
jgi:hypothetical protein